MDYLIGGLGLLASTLLYFQAPRLAQLWLKSEYERDNPLFKEARIEFVQDQGHIFIRICSILMVVMFVIVLLE